jgi:hypothetical protein
MAKRLIATIVVCCLAAVGFTAASAVSASGSTTQNQSAQVHVGFKLGKFVAQHHRLVAHGSVTATSTLSDGTTNSVTKPFNAVVHTKGFRVLAARTCAVLDLQLDKLALSLLGLNVNLDKVILTIKANPHEGVLGSLFCALAHTKLSKLRSLASYARKLTAVTHKSGLSRSGKLLGFSTPIVGQQQTATGAICPILDLILGPLHVDLLGLIVDLNQVHLTITADPNGGILGSLFCSLASTTTLPTTT